MATKSARRKSAARGSRAKPNMRRVTVQSLHSAGYTARLNADKYSAMRRALMKVLPAKPPGLTYAEMLSAVIHHLPKRLFPGGAKAGWWVKTVQLDLEVKGVLAREQSKPLRWHRKTHR